jgi:folate-dependent phosphoribosylglycinamide formyltransferase PurN
LTALWSEAGETVHNSTVTADEGHALQQFAFVTKRVAILISGGGSNMVALVNSMQGRSSGAAVLVVQMIQRQAGFQRRKTWVLLRPLA